ncbi:MAG: hypothetical protein WCA98_16500 [Candidatus Acidiferrales bacterium]
MVGLIQSSTHHRQTLLKELLLLLLNLFLAAFIAQQGRLELRQDSIGNMDINQDLRETVPQLLFPEVGKCALSSKLRAAVIRVFSFLDLGGYLAVVIGTGE